MPGRTRFIIGARHPVPGTHEKAQAQQPLRDAGKFVLTSTTTPLPGRSPLLKTKKTKKTPFGLGALLPF